MPGVEMAGAVTGQTAENREQESRREAADEASYEHPVHRCVHFYEPGLLSSRQTCGDTGFRCSQYPTFGDICGANRADSTRISHLRSSTRIY
jgi:hypothetical protein